LGYGVTGVEASNPQLPPLVLPAKNPSYASWTNPTSSWRQQKSRARAMGRRPIGRAREAPVRSASRVPRCSERA